MCCCLSDSCSAVMVVLRHTDLHARGGGFDRSDGVERGELASTRTRDRSDLCAPSAGTRNHC